MAVITVTNDLDVIEKYSALVKEALSGDSVYIRAKESMQDLLDGGSIDEGTKSEVISNFLNNLVNSLTVNSMQTALAWASAEKDIELKKLELAEQLDILLQEGLLKEAQVEQVNNAIRLDKVESKRMYGTATFDASGNITSLANEGKVYTDIQLVDANRLRTDAETTLTTQKLQESYAAVHKIVADTYVNYGSYTWGSGNLAATGLSTVTATHGVFQTLSDTQQEIAIEQAKGYTYNAWANALTGSASMLGTAIAADYADFGPGSTGETLLNTVLATATNLKNAATTSAEAIPA